jgi:hypothetical protein
MKTYSGTIDFVSSSEWNQPSDTWRYDFITIGGQRILDVHVHSFLSNFLEVGAPVDAVVHNTFKRLDLVALRVNGSVEKAPTAKYATTLYMQLGCAAAATSGLGLILGATGFGILGVAVFVGPWILLARSYRRFLKARNALDGASAQSSG